jgi:hypothetical protein
MPNLAVEARDAVFPTGALERADAAGMLPTSERYAKSLGEDMSKRATPRAEDPG